MPRGIFDRGAHPLVETLSQLRHTAVGNDLGVLFDRDRIEKTRKVLSGEAGIDELSDTRERLARWPGTRAAVEANLDAFEREYTPWEEGLQTLRGRLDPAAWDRLATEHRARMRERVGIPAFVPSVRQAIVAFEEGLVAVGAGRMMPAELARLHGVLVNACRIP